MPANPYEDGWLGSDEKRDIEKAVIQGVITGLVVWFLINKVAKKVR